MTSILVANYFSITKGLLAPSKPTPSTIIIGVNGSIFMPKGSGNKMIIKARILPTFNLVTEFFEEFHTNY
jgi:hypothetical protein